jgi:eukaryotic-like serine/threonine-protein kinase
MSRNRESDIERICQAALEREADSRATFLVEACAGNDRLRREVESLLARETAAERFIETPALHLAAQGMAGRVPVGTRIGAYAVRELLGAGGMGEVYRARDPQLGREVAIKVLPPFFLSDPERLARFDREARLLAYIQGSHASHYGHPELEAEVLREPFPKDTELASRGAAGNTTIPSEVVQGPGSTPGCKLGRGSNH